MAMIRWDDMSWEQRLDWYKANEAPYNLRSARAIRLQNNGKYPDSQLTKGFVKKLKKDTRDINGWNQKARAMQRASHKLDRQVAKREIELGLQDYELELEAQEYQEAIDFYETGDWEDWYDFNLPVEDFNIGIYFALEDTNKSVASVYKTKLRGQKYDVIILDDMFDFETLLPPMREEFKKWNYKHEGD